MAMLFTACSKTEVGNQNVEKIDLSKYPIETDVTLTYFKPLSSNVSSLIDNFAQTELAKEYAKRTGVTIEYIHPVSGQGDEALSLMISSNDLPDIIENSWIRSYAGGPIKALEDDVIISLNNYRKYAPALFDYLAERPEYDRAAKTDTGEYIGFPLIMDGPKLAISAGPAVRMDWLRELGMNSPETVADWENMLIAFRDKKGATAPLSFNYNTSISNIFAMLETSSTIYRDGDVIKYGCVQPEFKRALTILNDWLNKGLLDKNIVSVDKKVLDNQILNNKTGASFLSGGSGIGQYMQSAIANNPNFDLSGVKYPTFERGKKNVWLPVSHPISGEGTAAITTQCKTPELAAKVLDYFFTEEGYMLGNFGVEGVTYTMENGVPTYTDLILNNPDGLTVSQALGLHVKAGSGSAFPMSEGYIDQYYSLPQQKAGLEAWLYSAEESLKVKVPPVTPTSDETTEYSQIMNEVTKYQKQMIVKFITGIEPIDKFDEFVATMNKFGLERALEIQTAALKRFNSR